MYEEFRVTFKNGTSTLLWVSEDDSVQDAVLDLCDHQGWNTGDVKSIKRTGKKRDAGF